MQPRRCAARSRASVTEIIELQRDVQFRAAQQRHRLLQVITLLARDAHLVALQARLHLEPGILDEARDLLAGFLVDAMLEYYFLLRRGEFGLRLLDVQTHETYTALGQP